MKENIIRDYLEIKKNYVFLGEAGSGKTEVSVNMALAAAELADKPVHFFDMDQTKPLFRARNSEKLLTSKGVIFHYQDQVLDSPTVATGVVEALKNPDCYVIMDVGGGAFGSHMIGQFSPVLSRDETCILYLFNPYRPWSGNKEDIEETMRRVLSAARLSKIDLVGNPNFGIATTADDVVQGMKLMHEQFPDTPISFVSVLDYLYDDVSSHIKEPLFPVAIKTLPIWMRQ